MQLVDLTQQPRKLTQQLPEQGDLLNLLDSVVESSLLQAPPLQPMEPTLNQDSERDTCSLFSAVSVHHNRIV